MSARARARQFLSQTGYASSRLRPCTRTTLPAMPVGGSIRSSTGVAAAVKANGGATAAFAPPPPPPPPAAGGSNAANEPLNASPAWYACAYSYDASIRMQSPRGETPSTSRYVFDVVLNATFHTR